MENKKKSMCVCMCVCVQIHIDFMPWNWGSFFCETGEKKSLEKGGVGDKFGTLERMMNVDDWR
jgi:hypothetical protein